MKWSDLSKTVQALSATVGAIIVIGGAVIASYTHFQTASAAEKQHKDIYEEIDKNQKAQMARFKNDRVDRHTREIKRLEYKLLSEELTDKQMDYIRMQIKELNATIQCIREEKC